MSEDEARRAVIHRLIEKANQALASARQVLSSGDAGLATNRVYYACFYAVSAILLDRRRQFVKHAGVRAALHQHLVKTGLLSQEMGRFYDTAFSERQEADYNAMASFDPHVVEQRIAQAEQFVELMKGLLPSEHQP